MSARRGKAYKFTGKRQSGRGIFALVLAGVSVLVFFVVVILSYMVQGNGSVYLGTAGIAALLVGLIALVLAVGSLREENSYKIFPCLATFFSLLISGVWIALYVVGSL